MFDSTSEIQKIETPLIDASGVKLFMQRDDKIHPFVSGNKWYKLKYNFDEFNQSEATQIVTFGGAFSNHLVATAVACAMKHIPCVGIVRGEELHARSNYVLRLCKEFGMELQFVPRVEYKNPRYIIAEYKKNGSFIIPEGGDNEAGRKGCEEIVKEYKKYSGVVVPVGTSTTLSGIVNASANLSHVHGIAAVGEANYLNSIIDQNTNFDNWSLHTSYSYGGFGKYDTEQISFNGRFARETGILLDPVYTGKMMRGIYDLIEQKVFQSGDSVLCIHTGGLTGILSEKWKNL